MLAFLFCVKFVKYSCVLQYALTICLSLEILVELSATFDPIDEYELDNESITNSIWINQMFLN